jgi:hypothetical protein
MIPHSYRNIKNRNNLINESTYLKIKSPLTESLNNTKTAKKDNPDEENSRFISTYKRYIERSTNLRENLGNLKRISITKR